MNVFTRIFNVALAVLLCVSDLLSEGHSQAEIEAIRDELRAELAKGEGQYWEGDYARPIASYLHGEFIVGPTSLVISGQRYVLDQFRMLETGTIKKDFVRVSLDRTSDPALVRDKKRVPVSEFMIIRWGERVYLVGADCVIAFCNDINAGREPRGSDYEPVLLKSGTSLTETPTGMALVPMQYQKYLLKRPIEGVVRAVGQFEKDVPIKGIAPARSGFRGSIDVGESTGLLPGMELWQTPFDGESWYSAVVVSTAAGVEVLVRPVYGEGPPQRPIRMSTHLPALPQISKQ